MSFDIFPLLTVESALPRFIFLVFHPPLRTGNITVHSSDQTNEGITSLTIHERGCVDLSSERSLIGPWEFREWAIVPERWHQDSQMIITAIYWVDHKNTQLGIVINTALPQKVMGSSKICSINYMQDNRPSLNDVKKGKLFGSGLDAAFFPKCL